MPALFRVRSLALALSLLFSTHCWSLALPLFVAVSVSVSVSVSVGYIRNVLLLLQLVAFETLSSFVMLAKHLNRIQAKLFNGLCVLFHAI